MKVDKGKISEWTASGIVGGIALTIVMGIVSFVTGSITVVAPFVWKHPGESAACAGTVFFLGVLTGLVAKGRIDSKERTENNEESPILTGETALNFVRCLTDNQHEILKEMRDNGGTLEADPLDGDMQQLAKYGMVERPPMFAPGVDTKWTLPPDVNRLLRDHPDVLEAEESKAAEQDRIEVERAFTKVCSTCLIDGQGRIVSPLLFDTDDRHLKILGLSRRSVKDLEDLGLIRKRENLAPVRDVIRAKDLNVPLTHISDGVEIENDSVTYRFKSGTESFKRNRQQWKPAGKWGGICYVVDLGMYEFTSKGLCKAEAVDTPTAANIRAYVSTFLADSHIEEEQEQG